MDSTTLKTWQAAKLGATLGPTLKYLYRLQRRMEKVGFTGSDRLMINVNAAYTAMHNLCVELHYLSCESGVGREPRKQD